MNAGIGKEATQFHFREYLNQILVMWLALGNKIHLNKDTFAKNSQESHLTIAGRLNTEKIKFFKLRNPSFHI
jgi:hypothetical protein